MLGNIVKSKYVSIDQTFLLKLLSRYRIEECKSLRLLKEDLFSITYLIKTLKTDYILKIFDKTIPNSSIEYSFKLLQFLGNLDHRVPIPLFSRQGNFIDESLLNKKIVILSYLEGQSISTFSLDQVNDTFRKVGNLHLSMKTFSKKNPPLFPFSFVNHIHQLIDEYFKIETSEDLLSEFIEVKKTAQFLLNQNHTAGLCHNDLKKNHLLFSNDRLNGILDFFCVYNFPLLLDVSALLLETCFDENGTPNFNLINNAIASYRETIPLTNNQWSFLPQYLSLVSFFRYLLFRAQKSPQQALYQTIYQNVKNCHAEIG